MKKLDHPNIVKFLETYQDNKYFHLVMEYCSGGELFDRLKAGFTELEVVNVMQKAISAVEFIHMKKICHRDLKPENFMFQTNERDAEIKIIDFGLAKKFQH